jgi:SulP family sulfate permease
MLCVIGVELIAGRTADMTLILKTSPGSTVAMLITFGSVLFIPLQWAIFLGAGLSFLVFLYTSATRGELVALRKTDRGSWEEYPPPQKLSSGKVTVLQHKGNQIFAQVAHLSHMLPSLSGVRNAVLILRARDLETAPTTGLLGMEKLVREMKKTGNLVMIAGVEPRIMKVLRKAGIMELLGEDHIFPAKPQRQAALDEAAAAGEKWIAEQKNVSS